VAISRGLARGLSQGHGYDATAALVSRPRRPSVQEFRSENNRRIIRESWRKVAEEESRRSRDARGGRFLPFADD
jgi:hypothetical protein